MATITQWVEGARPRTLAAAIAPVLVGAGAAGLGHRVAPLVLILSLIHIWTDPLGIDESLLTGEADVLTKVPGDTVLSGSVVATGRGYYEATAVGEHSYAHRLTATVRAFAPSRTPLQRQVDLVVRAVTLVVALMSFAILFQALLESFALTRIVQVSAVLSGQIPYCLLYTSRCV